MLHFISPTLAIFGLTSVLESECLSLRLALRPRSRELAKNASRERDVPARENNMACFPAWLGHSKWQATAGDCGRKFETVCLAFHPGPFLGAVKNGLGIVQTPSAPAAKM